MKTIEKNALVSCVLYTKKLKSKLYPYYVEEMVNALLRKAGINQRFTWSLDGRKDYPDYLSKDRLAVDHKVMLCMLTPGEN